jgi:NIMA (never in mitosis gene a)-related kinase
MPRSDYQKLQLIGSGSFGRAYLVQVLPSARLAEKDKLVMKEIDLSRMDQRERQSAKVEVEVLRCLKHPYIVRHWDHFLHDNQLCIVMDYCEGGDLSKYISQCKRQRTTIPEAQVLRWFTQMCLALKYMHEAGEKEGERHLPVLHRDIKSQNIFLSRREGDRMSCVKIADFGIAKVLQTEKSLARTQVGTPYYLSPEICQKQPYGEPSDVWALGCVLYELCALHVPFEAQEIFMLFDKILRSPAPRIPSTYSRELSEIGLEMLSREAHRRPSAAMMLKKPIVRAEIERMLSESRDRKFKEDRRDSREPSSARHGSQTPQRRPLGDHNPRSLPQTPQQRAGSKKRDSRAPSPTQEAAKQMLRPSRAPSPARDFPPVGIPLSGRRHNLLR